MGAEDRRLSKSWRVIILVFEFVIRLRSIREGVASHRSTLPKESLKVEAQDGEDGKKPKTMSLGGHEKVVQPLPEKGANDNAAKAVPGIRSATVSVESLVTLGSITASFQLAGTMVKLCSSYIADVKDARQDILRLQQKAAASYDVLQTIAEVNGRPNRKPLNLSADELALINQCSDHLRALQEKLQPKIRHRAMSKFGVRALKWPLSKFVVDDEVKTMERYLTVLNAALQVYNWTPDFVVGIDVGMTSTGVAWSAAPEWARPETIQHWPGTPGNGLADK